MMGLQEINLNNITDDLKKKNIIYGAGHNGKIVYHLLTEVGVPVEAFYDDDITRWGEEYCGKTILSKNQFEALDKSYDNIFISSIYTGKIADKLALDGFNNVYTFLERLLDVTSGHLKFSDYCDNERYLCQLDQLISLSEDYKTKQYFNLIKKSVIKGKPQREICDLYCNENQYFLDSFKGKLEGLSFIDGGAYTGDTVRELLENEIGPSKIYCFEADKDNYMKLQNYIKKSNGNQNNFCICENYALWDECMVIGMKRSGYNACVDMEKSNTIVRTMTIDKYFKNINVGFVKMDIEGAEQKALTGGMQVLKRDRPVLAISIYHSLDDIVKIPQMLMQQLTKYHFIVRNHSSTYSEAILYGVPDELEIQLI